MTPDQAEGKVSPWSNAPEQAQARGAALVGRLGCYRSVVLLVVFLFYYYFLIFIFNKRF